MYLHYTMLCVVLSFVAFFGGIRLIGPQHDEGIGSFSRALRNIFTSRTLLGYLLLLVGVASLFAALFMGSIYFFG